MQEINKEIFVNQLYDLYKSQIKKLSKIGIYNHIAGLGKSENPNMSANDVMSICEIYKISCYGLDTDDKLLVKYISKNNHSYKAFVWRISNDNFQLIEGNEKKSIIAKVSKKHLKKPPKIKKMVYCDVCKVNHRQILSEGVYYKECAKKWFICLKDRSTSFIAENSEESHKKAYDIWINMEMSSKSILDV